MENSNMEDVSINDFSTNQPHQSDLDPIKASYDVYIKPSMSHGRQIYVLQFPNREQPYNKDNHSQPLKLRIKPEAGMVELDVPVDAWRNYDREKGIKWGEAMKKSNMTQGGRSHGLPGGFSIGGGQSAGRGRGRGEAEEEINQEKLLADYAGAIQREQVLTKQTLGGQTVLNEDTNPQYMIGTFRNNQLHLIPADHIVQMRPQFHHIDAHSEQERLGRSRDPNAPPLRPQEARSIHMTVKNTIDGEEDTTDTMQERIIATQAEPWRHHSYVDENDHAAWESFDGNLFVGALGETNEELQQRVPKLSSAYDDSEYLNIISAPRDATRLSRSNRPKKDRHGKGKEGAEDGEQSDSTITLSDGLSDSDIEDHPAAS